MKETYIEVEEIKSKFCSELSSRRPSHCESMVGNTIFWPISLHDPSAFWSIPSATNGCGTGSFVESAVSMYVEGEGYGGFSGDADEPITGYPFTTACNTHDLCYSAGSGQQVCDTAFHNSMTQTCGSDYDCQTFADFYSSAVKLFGAEPYTEAGLVQQCREFKTDMGKNCEGAGGVGST